jgi:hypothetical protein
MNFDGINGINGMVKLELHSLQLSYLSHSSPKS